MIPGIHLDYQELRGISPKAARRAILQILASLNGNIAATAKTLGTTRVTVYKALKKAKEECLDDASRSPRVVHNKTSSDIEKKVIDIKNLTNYGPLRIKEELWERHGITLSHHTIRNIIRRNRGKLTKKVTANHGRSNRPFIDWYEAKPFEIVQIDLKYIVDHKALSPNQITHIYTHSSHIPMGSA